MKKKKRIKKCAKRKEKKEKKEEKAYEKDASLRSRVSSFKG